MIIPSCFPDRVSEHIAETGIEIIGVPTWFKDGNFYHADFGFARIYISIFTNTVWVRKRREPENHNQYGPAVLSDDFHQFFIHGYEFLCGEFIESEFCRCSDERKIELLMRYG